MKKYSLFQNNPRFLISPSLIQSLVSLSLSIFREFISAFGSECDQYHEHNFDKTWTIVRRGWFSDITTTFFEFRPSMNFKEAEAEAAAEEEDAESEDSDARIRIAALEGKADQYSHEISMLRCCDVAEQNHSALHRC
jgi:hypothetical protein